MPGGEQWPEIDGSWRPDQSCPQPSHGPQVLLPGASDVTCTVHMVQYKWNSWQVHAEWNCRKVWIIVRSRKIRWTRTLIYCLASVLRQMACEKDRAGIKIHLFWPKNLPIYRVVSLWSPEMWLFIFEFLWFSFVFCYMMEFITIGLIHYRS